MNDQSLRLEHAYTFIRALEKVAKADRALTVRLAGAKVSLLWLLEVALAQHLATARLGDTSKQHGGPDRASLRPEEARARWREWAFVERERARQALGGLTPSAKTRRQKFQEMVDEERPAILALVRSKAHVRDCAPVLAQLADRHGLSCAWVVARAAHAGWAKDAPVLVADDMPTIGRGASLRIQMSVIGYARRLAARPPVHADPELWRAMALELWGAVRRYLGSLLRCVDAVDAAVRGRSFQAFLLGSPTLPACRVLAAVGRAHGVPTIAIQHGDIQPTEPAWSSILLDRYITWGEGTAVRMRSAAVPCEVVAAGTPWLDGRPSGSSQKVGDDAESKTQRPCVLVGNSGPGHRFSQAEHAAIVARILDAAAALPDVDWIFRLHPKDTRSFYDEELERRARVGQGANVRVVEALGRTISLEEQLARAAFLLTAGSTTAADAMLAGVPVLTLDGPSDPPGYVLANATHRVGKADDLAATVKSRLAHGADPEVQRRAERFLNGFYGPRDGQSTGRTARFIAEMAAPSTL